MIDFGDLISRLRTLSHWTTLVKPMRDVQEEAASAIEILLSRTEGQKNRIDDLKEGIDKLLAEKNALQKEKDVTDTESTIRRLTADRDALRQALIRAYMAMREPHGDWHDIKCNEAMVEARRVLNEESRDD